MMFSGWRRRNVAPRTRPRRRYSLERLDERALLTAGLLDVCTVDEAPLAAEMAAEGEGPQVIRFTPQVFSTGGQPITSINVGEQFLLRVFVQDIRPAGTPERGVHSAYLDVFYDALLAAPVASSTNRFGIDITFGPNYQELTDLAGVGPGLINEVGAFQTGLGLQPFLPLGGDPQLLFTIRFVALRGGELTFQTDDADEPGNEVRLFEPIDPEIPSSQIDFRSTSIDVIAPAMALPDIFHVNQNATNVLLNPLANDTGAGALSIHSFSSTSAGGTLTFANNQTRLRYNAPAGYTGYDTFMYVIRDSQGNTSQQAQVTVVVGNVPNPHRHPSNPLDVDNSGFVSINDVLLIVNDLRDRGPRQLPLPPVAPNVPPPFLDVNGDGLVTVNDALLVINHLRNQIQSGGGGGEGEASALLAAAAWWNAERQRDDDNNDMLSAAAPREDDWRWAVEAEFAAG